VARYLNSLSPVDLGIILSYRCKARCKHCLYACGPGWKETMSLDDVREAVEATKFWTHAFRIHLTGGEPFLDFDLLVQATRIVAERGVPLFAETDASWCTGQADAREKFAALKNAGMDSILISCSPFQSETIPLNRVATAIKAAFEVFGSRNTTVYLPHCIDQIQAFSTDKPVPLDVYIERYGEERAGRMFWDEYGLIGGGRASYRLGHLTKRSGAEAFQGEHCAAEILFPHHSHFDVYGNHISWFCGGLSVGSWRELPEMTKDFHEGKFPSLIRVLVTVGPFGLFQRAEKEYGYVELEEGYTGKCHLCVDLRKHLLPTGGFPELSPAQFYEML
jgi:hypothetical protein